VARSSRKYFSRIWLHPRHESRGGGKKKLNAFYILLWLPPETYHPKSGDSKENILQNLANFGFSFSFSFSHEKFFVWVKIIFFSCRNLATIRQ